MRRKRFCPAVCSFHHPGPKPRTQPHFLSEFASLAATADVPGEADLLRRRVERLVKVIACGSRADALDTMVRSGLDGRGTGSAAHRGRHQIHVDAQLRTLQRQSERSGAELIGQEAALVCCLCARTRGLGKEFFPPPKGELVLAPSILNQLQGLDPFSS